MAFIVEEKHREHAERVSGSEEARKRFMAELARASPEFYREFLAMQDSYVIHYIQKHLGTFHPDKEQLKRLADSFAESFTCLVAAIVAAHEKIPIISDGALKEAKKDWSLEKTVVERFTRFHAMNSVWMWNFLAYACRFHIGGAEELVMHENGASFPGACFCGVGFLFALAEAFLKSAEEERSAEIRSQMQRNASAFADFIEKELGNIPDSFNKKEKED